MTEIRHQLPLQRLPSMIVNEHKQTEKLTNFSRAICFLLQHEGIFREFSCFIGKKLKKVLMILPSISDCGRANSAEYCRYMCCLAISNFYFLALLVKKLKKVLMILLIILSYFTIKFLVIVVSCSHCR